MFALSSSKRLAIAAVCAAALVVVSSAIAQDDPPPEAGRISYISGNVSVQAVTSDDWGQAYPNLPVGPGDRIFTDSDGRAEIQVGQTYVRIGPNSDVTLVDDSAFNINFGIAQGSIHLHSFGLWPRQLLDISTPNGNAEFGNSGDSARGCFAERRRNRVYQSRPIRGHYGSRRLSPGTRIMASRLRLPVRILSTRNGCNQTAPMIWIPGASSAISNWPG